MGVVCVASRGKGRETDTVTDGARGGASEFCQSESTTCPAYNDFLRAATWPGRWALASTILPLCTMTVTTRRGDASVLCKWVQKLVIRLLGVSES